MPVVASWDWENRLIYMAVADYDPIDIYREQRELRTTDETARNYYPMVRAIGGLPKGGGNKFGNALQMLSGATFTQVPSLPIAKIVPLDSSGVNTLSGEVVTDNPDVDSDPFDSSSLVEPPRIVTSPISVVTELNGDNVDVTVCDHAEDLTGNLDVPALTANFSVRKLTGHIDEKISADLDVIKRTGNISNELSASLRCC